MSNEKQVVNYSPKELGIPDEKAKEIRLVFEPMLKKMDELEQDYNAIVEKSKKGVTKELCDEASELLKQYVKVRTGTDKIHKSAKKFYLVMGRAVDGFKNAQLAAGSGKEETLKSIKDHFENLEKERLAKIEAERIAELEKYEVDTSTVSVGTMSEDVWNNFLAGCKLNYETKKAAEDKAEREAAEKIRKENAYNIRRQSLLVFGKFFDEEKLTIDTTEEEYEKLLEVTKKAKEEDDAEQERIRKENEEIKKKQEEARQRREKRGAELKPFLALVEDFNALLEASDTEYNKQLKSIKQKAKKAAEEKAKAEAKAAAEKKAAEEKAEKEKAAAEAKLKKEREAREKLEKEKKEREEKEAAEKKAAEEKAAAEKKAKEEADRKLALSSDKEILTMWIDSAELQLVDISNMDQASKEIHKDIVTKFNSFKKWAKSQVKEMK